MVNESLTTFNHYWRLSTINHDSKAMNSALFHSLSKAAGRIMVLKVIVMSWLGTSQGMSDGDGGAESTSAQHQNGHLWPLRPQVSLRQTKRAPCSEIIISTCYGRSKLQLNISESWSGNFQITLQISITLKGRNHVMQQSRAGQHYHRYR